MDQPPYTSADFHDDVHKQLVSIVTSSLADTKLGWSQVAAFLAAGRALCRDDVRYNGRLALHGVEYRDGELAEADEAYLSLSVRDREDGVEWLSQTYWLSDIALADQDPERLRGAIAAMERSVAKLKQWLADREPPEDAPAADPEQLPLTSE
jgi:uncharacterized Ntn-hydrolase superfamily protein